MITTFIQNFRLLFISVLLITLSSSQSFSQIGVKGGLNISNLYVDEVDDQNPRIGAHIGLLAELPITEAFALQPELIYTTKGAQYDYSVLDLSQRTTLNLNYIQLPVMANIYLSEAVAIQGGVYGSYLLGVGSSTEGDLGEDYEELNRDQFNTLDYGLSAGMQFHLGSFIFGIRYDYGLVGVGNEGLAEESLGNAKNSALQLSVGFSPNP